jgi:hypothetical protein
MNNVLLEGLVLDELIWRFRSSFLFYRFKNGIPLALVPVAASRLSELKSVQLIFTVF